MPRCPSLRENGIDGTDRSAESGEEVPGRRAEHGHRTHRNTSPPFLQLGKRRPRAPGRGERGRFGVGAGTGLFVSMCSAEIGNQPTLTKECYLTDSATMHFYPFAFPLAYPPRCVGGRKGPRLAFSDLVTVSVEPGGSASQSTHFQSSPRPCCITRPPATVSAWICSPCRPAMIPPVHTMLGRCAGTAQTYWPLCPFWQL